MHVAPEHVVPMVNVSPMDVVVTDAPTARLVVTMDVNRYSAPLVRTVTHATRPIRRTVVLV